MDKDEFLFLIPGVLYGVAVFDLLSLVRNKKNYWESILWAVLLFFTLIGLLFVLYDDLVSITSNIFYYSLFLFSPILFVQSCYLISPSDPKDDMKEVFMANRKPFFLSLAGVVFVNTLTHILVTNKEHLLQALVFVLIFGANAFVDKVYVRIITAIILTGTIVMRYIEFA